MSKKLYDETILQSIIEYAQRLETKTIDIVNSEQNSYAGRIQKSELKICTQKNNKGSFGNYLEYAYFGKELDNKSQPDFPVAKLELKASPLKTLSSYDVKVKE